MKLAHKLILLALLTPLAGFSAVTYDQLPHLVSSTVPTVAESSDDFTGTVSLLVNINEHGYVTGASIKDASDIKMADSCLKAVRSWRYVPAMKDGKAVAATFVQPFRLADQTLSTEEVTASAKALHREAPELDDALQNISGQVTLVVHLGEDGAVRDVKVAKSTHEELNTPCAAALQKWTFSPAVKQGKKVASTVYVPFNFIGREVKTVAKVPVVRETLADNHELTPLRQTMPNVPAELQAQGGDAKIAFSVDQYGYVSSATIKSSSNTELAEIARKTVLNWKFKPIVRAGKAIAVNAVQPFNFGERAVVAEVVDRMPKPNHMVSPEMPDSLRGVNGRVTVLFTIKNTGDVTAVEVKDSSTPEMTQPILAAAKQWTFKPAIKDGKPVDSRVLVPFYVGAD